MMPTAMLSPLIPGAIEFLVFLLLVPFGVRSPWPRSLVTRMLGTAVLVHTGFALLMFGVLPGLKFWHATATFGLLFMGLWFVYGVVTKSVSALVVMRLWQDRKDHAPEVLTGQIAQQEFMTRVDLLAEASLISPTPGGGWRHLCP